MGEALAEAEAALRGNEVPVGCVLVHPDRGRSVVGRGHNNTVASCNATRHAEMEAVDGMLAEGWTAADVAQCELYVTVEPCIMCASALRHIGVRKVVFGCVNDKFGGCGGVLNIHSDAVGERSKPMLARGGVREAEAIALLRRFYAQENQGAPVPQKRTRRHIELGAEEQEAAAVAPAASVRGEEQRTGSTVP